jgi:hypothetical protein
VLPGMNILQDTKAQICLKNHFYCNLLWSHNC